jgi:hypothetical protein
LIYTGQFEPEFRGQFHPESPGQFDPESGGHFRRNFQLELNGQKVATEKFQIVE